MDRSPKKRVWQVLLLLAVACVGWYFYSVFAMPDVHPHEGDGRFENTSWRFPWGGVGLPIPGYEITFDQIDLTEPFEATYEIADLSEPRHRVGVYFCIVDPERALKSDDVRKGLQGMIDIEVTDGTGHAVCHVKRSPADMIWADPEGGANTYGLYSLEESFFEARSGERYRIHVRYSPDPKLSGFEGFVFIRSGGSA